MQIRNHKANVARNKSNVFLENSLSNRLNIFKIHVAKVSVTNVNKAEAESAYNLPRPSLVS